MKIFDYPFPCKRMSTKGSDDTTNIGFAQGVFSDGRPFHAECWATEGITLLTFFFSAFGLENFKNKDFVEYLMSEGVIELIEGKFPSCGPGVFFDDSKHKMYSVSIAIGNEDGLLVDSEMPLHAWKRFKQKIHKAKILKDDDK